MECHESPMPGSMEREEEEDVEDVVVLCVPPIFFFFPLTYTHTAISRTEREKFEIRHGS